MNRHLAASAAAIAICIAAPAYAQERTFAFDIPAQNLGDAVRAFAKTTRQQVSFSGQDVRGKQSSGVKGQLGADEALRQLLQGTGVTYRRAERNVIVLAPSAEGNAGAAEAAASSGEEAQNGEGQEIVVTGTNISGINPVAPVRSYGRREIDRSGYTTAGQFVQSLPINFKGGNIGTGGGNSEENAFIGGLQNLENATNANLRGLGSAATLVLVNSHRVASSSFGTGVDLSLFPLEAIERIEVLPDGATAVYGADAVAGVVNVILRQDYSGAETFGQIGSAQGGRTELRASQTLGRKWSSGGVMATAAYEHITPLDANERSFTRSMADSNDLLPRRNAFSTFATAHQDLTDKFNVTADVLYRDSDDTRDVRLTPTSQQQHILVDSGFMAAHAGVEWSVFDDWRLSVDGTYSKVNTLTRVFYTPPQPGYINGDPNVRNKFVERSAEAKVDGSLFQIPGGAVRFALGASHRSEDFSNLVVFTNVKRQTSRNIESVYGELFVPLVSAINAFPLVNKLSISLAGRIDSYSSFGTTRNPRIGVLWSPADGLSIRGSYSKAFRAPTALQEITNTLNSIFILGGYALPEGGTGRILLVPNQDPLSAETASIYNLSATYEPRFLSGLRLQMSAYRIRFSNAIVRAPSNLDILTNPAVYGPLATSFASDAAVTSYVTQLITEGYTLFDATGRGGSLAGIRYAIPSLNINAAHVFTQGVDLSASYNFRLWSGQAYVNIDASIIDKLETSFCLGCATTDLVDTTGNPVDFRGRLGAGWSRGRVQVNGAVNYTDDYTNTRPIIHAPIRSYTTVDLNFRYLLSILQKTSLGLSVINLFDRKPPFVGFQQTPGLNYDPANASPIGRFISLQLRASW